ncbi:MAG: cache domain-containing protein, partial [Defluviitaleaceae bacterium]|nr:cache domain-containing protein [Defluviitaleaceae bacterium]
MISSNKSGISKFFKRYFMAYIVMLVITIIAFFILYNRSSFILENIYIDNQLVALRQVSTRMDDNLAEIMNASFLVASNPRVRGIVPLSDPFGDTNVIRLREAMHSVAHFQTRNPLVANLFVAYEQGNVALNANFASNLEHFYIRHMQFYDMPFWYWRDMVFAETHRSRFIPAMYTQYQPHTQQQFIQYTTPIGGTAENRGVVVSLISNRAIYDKFREMNLGGESGSVFILSSQGEVISVVADSLGMQCIYDIPIGREGSSRFDRGSVSYLVSYTTSNLLGWTYVSVVRSDYVLAGLNVFRRSLLSVLLIAMAVTVVLSVIFSIQHARPMKKLEDAVAAHMPMLWYSYFHNLFKGQFYEENDALKGWEHLGLSLQGKLYKTVIVKIPDADSNINIGSVQAVAKLSMLLDEYTRGNTDADISIHRQPGGGEIAILFICGQCNTANIDGYVQ